MKTVAMIVVMTILTMGMLIVTPTNGSADEPVKITEEVREVRMGDTRLQLIPTNRGLVIVQGKLANDKLTDVMLVEGVRPAQVKITPHTHTQTLVVHRELDEQLRALIEQDAKFQGD